jgi:hypothetical protein
LLFTIDTEGDNLWSRPSSVTTENSRYLPRFHDLCVRYAVRPTYLVNWEMANDPRLIEFARGVLSRGEGEIGMHLHAWDSPPVVSPTDFGAYLIEYSEPTMRQKVKTMTDKLEDALGVKMLSHRAGRWAFNDTYATILAENGYKIDTSVTPHVSWKSHPGAPGGDGGSDYTRSPEHAYNIETLAGTILEIPMSIIKGGRPFIERLARKLLRKSVPDVLWMRPSRRNLRAMQKVMREAVATKRDYLQLMLHSSELMPGGSPTFKSAEDIERLYQSLDRTLREAMETYTGRTLSEYDMIGNPTRP